MTLWTVAHQTLLSMELSWQEYLSEQLFPSLGNLPDQRIKSRSPALQVDSLPSEPPGKPLFIRSDIPEKRMSEFEDVSTETTETENQGDKGLKVKTKEEKKDQKEYS